MPARPLARPGHSQRVGRPLARPLSLVSLIVFFFLDFFRSLSLSVSLRLCPRFIVSDSKQCQKLGQLLTVRARASARARACLLGTGVVNMGLFSLFTRSRECVMFIGTRFSNLYTAVDTPAEAAWLCA